jgi:hypothetical protein
MNDRFKQLKDLIELINEVHLIEKSFFFYHCEGKKINEEMESIISSKQDLFPEGQERLVSLKKQFKELVIRYNKDCSLANKIINKAVVFVEKNKK